METVSLHYHWGANQCITELNNKCNTVTALHINGTVRQSTMILIFMTLFGENESNQNWAVTASLVDLLSNRNDFYWKARSTDFTYPTTWRCYQLSKFLKNILCSTAGWCISPLQWRWCHLWFTVVARRCLFFDATERLVLMSIGTPCTGYL